MEENANLAVQVPQLLSMIMGKRAVVIGPDLGAGTGVFQHFSAVLQQELEPIGAQETHDSMIAQHW
ncbi:hypothetical protein ASZ90_016999 [hydrocarbon metagenome]|uniref:Uncharacterized protein n=1 Tax=hydrocarbon metagenome TaxID=938273 RepID=A0A0W8EA84_9ZZZZ